MATENAVDWSAVEQARGQLPKSPQTSPEAVRWTKDERRDVEERLFRLVVPFLRLSPFYDLSLMDHGLHPMHSTKQRWIDAVVAPSYPFGRPPSIVGIKALFDVLCRTMIRNRPPEVAEDRPLPPLRRYYIPVELSDAERKIYNAIQALISSNAFLSKREGHDYFFHPINRRYLIQIITNLSLACFHFALPERLLQVQEASELLRRHLTEDRWKGDPDLGDSLSKLREAHTNLDWRVQSVEIMYSVVGLPSSVAAVWTPCPPPSRPRLSATILLALQSSLNMCVSVLDLAGDELDELVPEEMITADAKWMHARAEMGLCADIGAAQDGDQDVALLARNNRSYSQEAKTGRLRMRRDKISPEADVHRLPIGKRMHRALPAGSFLRRAMLIDCNATKMVRLLQIMSELRALTLIFSSMDNSLCEISALFDVLSFCDRGFRHRISRRACPRDFSSTWRISRTAASTYF